MARLFLAIILVFSLSALSSAATVGFDPFFLFQGMSKVQPMKPPGEINVSGTKEAEKGESEARLGMGIKTVAIFLPVYNINAHFNREHGLELDLAPSFWDSGISYAVYYNKLLKAEAKRRSYFSLGLGGSERSRSISPAIKWGAEAGEYRGGNWILEIGYPILLGFGYTQYV